MTAKDREGCLVGHAFYVRYHYPPSASDMVVWITQLVLRAEYRNMGVATRMLRICCEGVGEVFACGLVSSHPYAVKALEAATSKKYDKNLSAQHAARLVRHSRIPYVQDRPVLIDATKCVMKTDYSVDHTLVDIIRLSLRDWQLGSLDEGEAHFAFVFRPPPDDLELH